MRKTENLRTKKSPCTVAGMFMRWIGKKVLVNVLEYPEGPGRAGSPGVQVAGLVLNARVSYGNARLLVIFPHGRGTTWIGEERCQLCVHNEWPEFNEPKVMDMVGQEESDLEEERAEDEAGG